MDNNLKLWYKEPAKEWVEGLPLGNGRLGAMVFGDVYDETIALNEDTLWTGIPRDKKNYEAISHLEEVRELIFNGKYYEAQKIMDSKMLADYTECYTAMGNLYLSFKKDEDIYEDYVRELDLNNAKATISYKVNNIKYKREIFVSAPHDAIIIKLSADKEKSINFTAALDSLLRCESYSLNENTIALKGITPIREFPDYANKEDYIIYDDEGKMGMRFKVEVKAEVCHGSIEVNNGVMSIKDATSVILVIVGNTSFNGYDKEPGSEGKDEGLLCKNQLENIEKFSYDEILKEHIDDYRSLFSKVEFNLGKEENNNIPTNERLERFKSDKNDLSLISLYFQYGRYLLISSSRKGTEPANLQGIWNKDVRPIWCSNYTTNINVEMNYWAAEVCNLSDCHEPLLRMAKELSVAGVDTAKEMFNCNGWVTNHNTDLWRYSSPVGGNSQWGFWPMGGAWMCQHLWEHYDFTRDRNYLKNEAYPVMKGAAEFLLDWLIEDKDGNLVTCPSTSPENNFLDEEGRVCCPSIASTMDISIIRDLFKNCIQASNVLQIDNKFKSKLIEALEKLPKYKINKYGGIQEWFKDFDESEPGHRHMSHLFGLYPGKEITEKNNKELYEACKKTLERRLSQGGGHTGWSCAWIINFYARLKEPEIAKKYLNLLLEKFTTLNLFCIHPPFQIDGNFGGIAGIAEMLIQSHEGSIEILPSIPSQWKCGSVKGLRARGGFIVDFKWNNNEITEFLIKSTVGGKCKIKSSKGLGNKMLNNEVEIDTIAGVTYRLK